MSELGVLDVVAAERRFNVLNLDRLQHHYMRFKAKSSKFFPCIIFVFLHDLCKQGAVRTGCVCVCVFSCE